MAMTKLQVQNSITEFYKEPAFKIETVDGESVVSKKVVVYSFTVDGNIEDPDLLAAEPLCNWEKSEIGRWVMEHSTETPTWQRTFELSTYSHRYSIVARLTDRDRTFFELKFK